MKTLIFAPNLNTYLNYLDTVKSFGVTDTSSLIYANRMDTIRGFNPETAYLVFLNGWNLSFKDGQYHFCDVIKYLESQGFNVSEAI